MSDRSRITRKESAVENLPYVNCGESMKGSAPPRIQKHWQKGIPFLVTSQRWERPPGCEKGELLAAKAEETKKGRVENGKRTSDHESQQRIRGWGLRSQKAWGGNYSKFQLTFNNKGGGEAKKKGGPKRGPRDKEGVQKPDENGKKTERQGKKEKCLSK